MIRTAFGGRAAKTSAVNRSPSRLADWSCAGQFEASRAIGSRKTTNWTGAARSPSQATAARDDCLGADRHPEREDQPGRQQVVREVAEVVRVDVDVEDRQEGQQEPEPPIADEEDEEPDDARRHEHDVRQRHQLIEDVRERGPRGPGALDRSEVHVPPELGAADVVEEPVPGEECAVDVGRSGERRGAAGTGRGADRPRTPPNDLREHERVRGDLAAGIDQHEQDHDRDDADGQRVVRDAQAGEQRADEAGRGCGARRARPAHGGGAARPAADGASSSPRRSPLPRWSR